MAERALPCLLRCLRRQSRCLTMLLLLTTLKLPYTLEFVSPTCIPQRRSADSIAASALIVPNNLIVLWQAMRHKEIRVGSRVLWQPVLSTARSRPAGRPALRASGGASADGVGVDLNQIAIAALAESLEGLAQSDKIVTKCLRKLGRSVNNHQRATLARRILGTSVLRLRLSFIADFLNASAAVPSRQDGREQHRAAELLALYILHEEHRVMAGQETFDDAEMTKGDAELGRGTQDDAENLPPLLPLPSSQPSTSLASVHETALEQVLQFLPRESALEMARLDLQREVWGPLQQDSRQFQLNALEAIAIETSMPLWILKRWLKTKKSTPQEKKSGGGKEKRASQLDNSALTAPRSADVCATETEEEDAYAKEEDGGIQTAKKGKKEAKEEDVCIKEEVLEELRTLCRCCNAIPPVHLRANTLVAGRDTLIELLRASGTGAEAAALSPWGVTLAAGRPSTGLRTPHWEQGLFEVQDLGSQVIAQATDAKPGEIVMDYCAGNGGKALAMAAMLQGDGLVVAHDIELLRLKQIVGSLARARIPEHLLQVAYSGESVWLKGPAGAQVRDVRVEAWRRGWAFVCQQASSGGGADVVLVDAPCSSLGVIRRHPSLRWELQEGDVEAYAAVQLEILLNASRLVRPGGRLVYATCSLDFAENTAVADAFERTHENTAVADESERTQGGGGRL